MGQTVREYLLNKASEIAAASERECRSMTSGEKRECESVLAQIKEMDDGAALRDAFDRNDFSDVPVPTLRKYAQSAAEKRELQERVAAMRGGVGGNGGTFANAIRGAGFDAKSAPGVEVSLASAIGVRSKDGLTGPGPETWNVKPAGDIAALPRPSYLHPSLPTTNVTSETAISDFVQTGARTVTGDVERALDATTDKATLAVTIEHVVPVLKMFAVLVEDVPNAMLESMSQLSRFLDASMAHEVRVKLDAHIVSAILAANPATESNGGDLIATARMAVASMRNNGAQPTILAVSPDIGADLDLTTQPGTDDYVFTSRSAGSASPLWNVQVIESVAMIDHPAMLIDPQLLGELYLGALKFEVDPYSGFSKNLSNLRSEFKALFHLRQSEGVVLLDSGS